MKKHEEFSTMETIDNGKRYDWGNTSEEYARSGSKHTKKNRKAMKNQALKLFLVAQLSIGAFAILADEIILTDGQSTKTEILDTSGCQVKINRNGNPVSIKKNLIAKIIMKTDTVLYDNYICKETRNKVTRIEDTPEYKIMTILDKAPQLTQVFPENSKLAYLQSPLQGNFNFEEFVGVQQSIVDLLASKASIQALNSEEMILELNAVRSNYDYALLTRQYHVMVNRIHSSGINALGAGSSGEKKKELFTTCNILLFDILKKEIVFHKIVTEKRSVWGESDYSWTGMLTPEKWKLEWDKKNTDRKLDKNAQAIRSELEKEFSVYLGIVR